MRILSFAGLDKADSKRRAPSKSVIPSEAELLSLGNAAQLRAPLLDGRK